jgi:hypothetical protein
MGGLGNQMFQYALGRHLAIKNNTELRMDLTFLLNRLPRDNFVFRNYDLDIFRIFGNFTALSKFSLKFNNLSFLIARSIIEFKKIIGSKKIINEKSDYQFDENILKLEDGVYLDGYWQSEKYFHDIENTLRKEFSFKEELKGHKLEMANKIKTVNSICINARRTDYVFNTPNNKFFAEIGIEYFRHAIDLIVERVSDPNIFVFSDDIAWCQENFNFGLPTVFVDHSFAGEKFGDYLHLMSLCKHFIIPNSTFAWWAAWLNPVSDKIVISPKKWVRDDRINIDDLIPLNWKRI